MELYNIDSLSIDPYTTFSASASYTFENFFNMGNLILSARVDNLFDKEYESAGYGGNFAYMDGGNLIVGGWAEYFAAAERSFYAQLKLELF